MSKNKIHPSVMVEIEGGDANRFPRFESDRWSVYEEFALPRILEDRRGPMPSGRNDVDCSIVVVVGSDRGGA
jgi:hypothetical protein